MFIGVYVLLTVLGVPMVILTFFAGFTFGALEGALYVMIGANIGANLAFDLARYLGRDFVSRYIKGPIDRIDRRLRKKGFLRMLQLRLIPVIPFNVLNFAAGLSGLRKLHFALATMIGITPGTFIYAYTAASLMQVYLAGAALDEVTRAALRTSALTNLAIALVLAHHHLHGPGHLPEASRKTDSGGLGCRSVSRRPDQESPNRIENRSASFRTKRRRTGVPFRRDRSPKGHLGRPEPPLEPPPPFHATGASRSSPNNGSKSPCAESFQGTALRVLDFH